MLALSNMATPVLGSCEEQRKFANAHDPCRGKLVFCTNTLLLHRKYAAEHLVPMLLLLDAVLFAFHWAVCIPQLARSFTGTHVLAGGIAAAQPVSCHGCWRCTLPHLKVGDLKQTPALEEILPTRAAARDRPVQVRQLQLAQRLPRNLQPARLAIASMEESRAQHWADRRREKFHALRLHALPSVRWRAEKARQCLGPLSMTAIPA